MGPSSTRRTKPQRAREILEASASRPSRLAMAPQASAAPTGYPAVQAAPTQREEPDAKEGKTKLPRGCSVPQELRADALLVQPRVSEGIQESKGPPGMHFSPYLVRKHSKSEMLRKQCNKQPRPAHLDSQLLASCAPSLMYINTHTHTFLFAEPFENHLQTSPLNTLV